jgi:electron transport complex protein RnfC
MGGVVGMGGAGFPTHVKLSPPEDKPIKYLIVNAAECEPYITSDDRRIVEQGEDVVDGLKICMELLGLEKGYIGIEENKPDAIKKLKKITDGSVRVVKLKAKYPQGGEKQLIKAVTGKKVPMGGLPADAGAIVINVDTA